MKPALVFAIVLRRYGAREPIVVWDCPYLVVMVRVHRLVDKPAYMPRLHASLG